MKFDAIIDFAGIGNFVDDPLRTYSAGMVVRLAFAVAVHTDPDVLLMDEVIGLGDQAFYARILDKIREFQRQEKTIVLASHSVELLTMLCQRALWLDQGKVVQLGPASQVAAGVLESVFCERGRCDAARVERFTAPQAPETVARVAPLR